MTVLPVGRDTEWLGLGQSGDCLHVIIVSGVHPCDHDVTIPWGHGSVMTNIHSGGHTPILTDCIISEE